MNALTDSRILALEERLRKAMLHSDVAALDALIHEELVFVGPDGQVYSKAQDLEFHRAGVQRLHEAVWHEVLGHSHAGCAVTCVTARLSGSFRGAPFSGWFRYVRLWGPGVGGGWQVLGGSVAAVEAPSQAGDHGL